VMSNLDAEQAVRGYVVPDVVSARLSIVIGRLNRRLTTAPGGLSHGLLMALSTVAKNGPLRLAELAKIEPVSAPSMTRTVTELESRGLVSRTVDPADRRAALLEATPTGLDAILKARAARADVIAELLNDLESADIAAIEAALPALERTLDTL
jgi:DNA-binding MarR family transcriptional regulator